MAYNNLIFIFCFRVTRIIAKIPRKISSNFVKFNNNVRAGTKKITQKRVGMGKTTPDPRKKDNKTCDCMDRKIGANKLSETHKPEHIVVQPADCGFR